MMLLGVSLEKLKEQVNDGEHALITITTDGLENSSHDFSSKAIKSIVSYSARKDGCLFILAPSRMPLR